MAKIDLLAWKQFFRDVGLREEYINLHVPYIKILISRKIPVIFEHRHLASLLGRTPKYITGVVNSTERHYRRFSIPKKRGGTRTIDAPYPALLECQKWIKHYILSRAFTPSDQAHAYVKKRSIITNAKKHVNKKTLLKVDIKNFFPSIKLPGIIALFKKIGYDHNVSVCLAKMCSLNGALPQGAATSPTISNIILNGMDLRLDKLAKKSGLEYTRYADDIVFSGDRINFSLEQIITLILSDFGFQLNASKTQLLKGEKRKIINGIDVTGRLMKVPKQFKRKLRQEIYYTLKYGVISHKTRKNIGVPNYTQVLIGKLHHWLSIEPDNTYAKSSLIALNKYISNPSDP